MFHCNCCSSDEGDKVAKNSRKSSSALWQCNPFCRPIDTWGLYNILRMKFQVLAYFVFFINLDIIKESCCL